MKEYTLEEWEKLPEKEKAKHNVSIMQMAVFGTSKVEFQDENGIWHQKSRLPRDIFVSNQYRLKPTNANDAAIGGMKCYLSNLFKIEKFELFDKFEQLTGPTQEEITAKFVKDNNLKIGDKSEWNFPVQSLEVVKYRPFKDGSEFEPYYDKGIHVRRKGFVEKLRVNGFDNEWVQIAHIGYYDYNYCLKHIEFINSITDGTGKPFGVCLQNEIKE